MRVCLATRYFDFRNAGIGRVSKEIVEELERRKIETFRISTEGKSLASYFKYTAFELPMRIPKGYDIYHALTPMEGIWMPKANSVATFYDLIPMLYPERAATGMNKNLATKVIGKTWFEYGCKRASQLRKIVCISEHTKSEVCYYFKKKPEDVEVARLGIREDLRPDPYYAKDNKVFTIGYLGQLDRRKRVHLLIEAIKSLPRFVELDCQIAGAGPEEEKLKALAGDDRRIKFLGKLPDSDLSMFYNKLNLFVFPTWIEGYGLPPVEAMACKIPTVVMGDSIIPWEIKSRCIVTDYLAEAIVSNGYYPGINIEDNYKFAKEHSWKECVDKYMKVYEEVSN